MNTDSKPITNSKAAISNPSTDRSLTLKIEKMIYGGWGLARCCDVGARAATQKAGPPMPPHPRPLPAKPGPGLFHGKQKLGGYVVFVPDVLPGEEVLTDLIAPRKGYAKANLTKILIPSPQRRNPPCPVFGTCGGCHLQHMSEEAQMGYKQDVLKETLWRIGQIRASPLPMINAPDPYRYRHRVQLKLSLQGHCLKMGFYQRESHHIVPVERCPILHPDLEHAMKVLQESLQGGLPFLFNPTEIHLQYSAHTAQVLLVFYAEEVRLDNLGKFFDELRVRLPLAGLVAYNKYRHRAVRGQPFLLQSLKGFTFRVSDSTFIQSNWPMNELLTDHLLSFAQLKGSETVLELYSGMGNFSLFLAKQARRVISMEGHPQAVKDAKYNARANSVANLEPYCCDVEKGLATLLKNPPSIDLIVLDPPRQGVGQGVLKRISELGSPRMLYLSCDPTTLARDLKFLLLQGYCLGRIQPFDLFPQTYHLETLVELEKSRPHPPSE